ncbi:DUF559 domain-containing protein [Staphylococcus petrasii]|uniref:DUF559 domain-containing protein n=1 Tax=Staphylococcus petrasii TaxID=1276936 RepID=UPI003F66E1D3
MNELQLSKNALKSFDKRGKFDFTLHENMFASLFPNFERQVTFGTGKNGLEKWCTKKFTADFFDPINNIVIEVDGSSHNNERQKIIDRLKEIFFEQKGIKVYRISNEKVKEIFDNECQKGVEILNAVFR